MSPIITSRFDTDGYKLTMGNILWQLNQNQNRRIYGRYEFYDRENRVFPEGFAGRLKDELNILPELPPEQSVADHVMKKWPFMNGEFLRWFNQVFYHDLNYVQIAQNYGKLYITVEGPIHIATHFEIPILRIISALLTEYSGAIPSTEWKEQLRSNAELFFKKGVAYSEFGGRRPRSVDVHREALEICSKFPKQEGKGGLLGTSWVKYASDYDLMIMGTMAHEYIQMMAVLYGYKHANLMAMQTWVEFYGKRLGYYLADTFTSDVALRDFNYFYASTFSGTRHDSGPEMPYSDKMVTHYQKLDIDPRTKAIVFSNSVDKTQYILDLNEYRAGKFQRSFGLGKYITNNVGYPGYNIVLKLVAVKVGDGDWIDIVKISDDPGKVIGHSLEIAHCKRELEID